MIAKAIVIEGGDSTQIRATVGSIRTVFDGEIQSVQEQGLRGAIMDSDAEAIHIVSSDVLILPSFYQAMLVALEHTGTDYAVCDMWLCDGDQSRVVPHNAAAPAVAQIVFKNWVLRELDYPPISELATRVISDYSGESIPHVLCVQING